MGSTLVSMVAATLVRAASLRSAVDESRFRYGDVVELAWHLPREVLHGDGLAGNATSRCLLVLFEHAILDRRKDLHALSYARNEDSALANDTAMENGTAHFHVSIPARKFPAVGRYR